MERHYILNGIGAFGRFHEDTKIKSMKDKYDLTARMLRCVFLYKSLKLQPIFIKDPRRGRHDGGAVPSCSCIKPGEYSYTSTCSGVYYQITLDDECITRSNLLNAINASLTLLDRRIEELVLISIESSLVPENRIIDQDFIISLFNTAQPDRWDCNPNYYLFESQSWSTEDEDKCLWQIVDAIIQDEKMMYIAHFWKSSYEEFSIGSGHIRSVILEHENLPLSMIDAVRVENALHNSYKVVEAVCGGTLPDDKKQIIQKLIKSGTDPFEQVGFEAFGIFKREPIVDKVLKLRDTRNDKAAHGRIHVNRKITFYDLMDLQESAKLILINHVIKKYPELTNIWRPV